MITADTTTMTVDGITQMLPHSLTVPPDFTMVSGSGGNGNSGGSNQGGPNSIPWNIRQNIMHASYPPPSFEVKMNNNNIKLFKKY